MGAAKGRGWKVSILAGSLSLLLFILVVLNAFKLPFLYPHSTGQIFLFTALTVLIFLLLVTVLVLLFRNVVKLAADQSGRGLGSKIRSRMLAGALLLSFAPAVFMFLFSFLLLNRSTERWFSQPSTQLREDASHSVLELAEYASSNAQAEAESLASAQSLASSLNRGDKRGVLSAMETHRITLEGGFAAIYRDRGLLAEYQLPVVSGPAVFRDWASDEPAKPLAGKTPADSVLQAAQSGGQPTVTMGESEYVLGKASGPDGSVVVVGLPLPASLRSTIGHVRRSVRDYWALFRVRNRVRRTYLLLLVLLTALTFFASSWLALFFSKQVTRPVEALADAMDEIAAGNYGHRVKMPSTDELGELVTSFNRMAADLDESRALAESSTIQLSAANRALEARRSELETVLETIPTGVVTLDAAMRVIQSNRAFERLLDRPDLDGISGTPLNAIFSAEIVDELIRLARRSQRMGVAAAEIDVPSPRGPLTFTATVARLDLGGNRKSYILVLEDVTEFLLAQRQMAWKEVAQRIAHEIKNPLTPITLSAERIRKHVDRPIADSPNVIRKCSDVILGSVSILRTLVDQFSALARFPAIQPTLSDLNHIVEDALALFSGQLDNIHIVTRLAADIPPVMADPEALKRALANLIDNAAEAMQTSLLRELTITTGVIEGQPTAEIVIADTGHGLSDEMRERLFLPYFSTKQRGTGLGLAIAAQVIQEHRGAIRAEQNSPIGARFIIELPLAEIGHPAEASLSTAAEKA